MATKRYRSLVTGACTPAGRILVEGLSANGHFVVATDSPEAFGADDGRLADAARAVRDVADMVVPVDPATPGTMDPLLAGVNFVFAAHSAPPDAPTWKARYNIDVQGTTNLIESIERAAPKLRRLVFISTAAIHGVHEKYTGAITEDSPIVPADDRARARWFGEFVVKDLCPKKGISYTILRPAHLVTDYEACDLQPLLWLLKSPVVLVPSVLNSSISLLSGRDLWGAADHVAKYASGHNQIFLVADKTHTTVGDVLKALASGAGKKAIDLPGPCHVSWHKALQLALEPIKFVGTPKLKLPQDIIESISALTHNRIVSPTQLEKVGGYTIKITDSHETLTALGSRFKGRE